MAKKVWLVRVPVALAGLKEFSGVQAATKHQSFNAMRIAEEVFQPIWLEPEYKLKGKRDCLSRLKSKNLYSSNSRALVNTILLAAEHQMALGPDERNQISHFWEGDISIEHVLPQVSLTAMWSQTAIYIRFEVVQ